MTVFQFTAAESGLRVDQFLVKKLPDKSRSMLQRLFEENAVVCDGKPVRKNHKTIAGQTYCVTIPEAVPLEAVPQAIPLDVVYEDADVIVINKPVGMVVHPAAGHPDGTLVNALLYHCGSSLSGINGCIRPGIVHRIDRDTSGLILAAKNDAAHLALAAQLQDHSLYREYHAVAVGRIRADQGIIDAPIGRDRMHRKKMAVDVQNGRPAVTHWNVLARYPQYTYLKCRLETGRTHQIRVHFSSIGHPLAGDVVYGSKKPLSGLAGQCLHAKVLSFRHPSTKERLTLECPLPEWFERFLGKIGRPESLPDDLTKPVVSLYNNNDP